LRRERDRSWELGCLSIGAITKDYLVCIPSYYASIQDFGGFAPLETVKLRLLIIGMLRIDQCKLLRVLQNTLTVLYVTIS
jgi:hypothetical protein